MKAVAVLLRLLCTISLLGLAGVLWLKWDTQKKQSHAFLDETVENAYTILQSAKEAQWKDVANKKSAVNDVFDANEQIDADAENPLELAIADLRTSEDAILRNPEYRDSLDELYKEFGPDALLWDKEKKAWIANPSVKLDAPAGFKDPFEDETKFPKHDVKKEDGSVVKGVSRQNRLRTVIGMFYKDRHDKFTELNKFRSMLVNRDESVLVDVPFTRELVKRAT